VRGERCDEETFPLPQSEHEILRDAAMQPDPEQMEAALKPVQKRILTQNPKAPAPLNAFRLPSSWERIIASIDGSATAAAILEREREIKDGLSIDEAGRAIYLGLSCELIDAA
jgi:hypothetical protein